MNDSRYDIVRVLREELQCPSCGSGHVRQSTKFEGPARPGWWFLRRQPDPRSCRICGRIDTHWHLCCAECGRLWDVG